MHSDDIFVSRSPLHSNMLIFLLQLMLTKKKKKFFQLYTACEPAASLVLVLRSECSDHVELVGKCD